MKSSIKNFFSRYHPRYIRSLVYMIQASEYRARDFLHWFWRTRDFLRVEQRKTLVKTPKALIFLAFGYCFLVLLYAFAIWILLVEVVWWKYFIFLVLVGGISFILTYAMAALNFLFSFLQWPVETIIVRQARRKLAGHKALKIAIAGSYGKTSMREILRTVLGAGKRVAAPPGSHNTPLGISSFVRSLRGDEEVLIFELGEYYPGDIKRLCNFVRPDIGVITGVNEAHLEKFRTIEQTRATIFELADYLTSSVIPAKAGIQRLLYINGENELATSLIPPFLKEVADRPEDFKSLPASEGGTPFSKGRIRLYSRTGAEDWKVERAQTGLQGTSFTLQNGSEHISIRSSLLGLHQVGPLTVAADIASKLGLTSKHIEWGIDATKPFEHRLEPKTDSQGVTTLDDSYNGNPDGVRAVIEFLASLKGVRRWYVTPGLVEMGPRKKEIHKEIGRQLACAGIEKVILLRNSVTPFIEKGLQEEKYQGEVVWFDKALDAFAALPNLTVKGDIVLLQNDWPDQYA